MYSSKLYNIFQSLTTTPPQSYLTPLPASSTPTHSEAAHKTISQLDGSCRLLDPSPQGRLGHYSHVENDDTYPLEVLVLRFPTGDRPL